MEKKFINIEEGVTESEGEVVPKRILIDLHMPGVNTKRSKCQF